MTTTNVAKKPAARKPSTGPAIAYDVRQSPVDGIFRAWVRSDWLSLGIISQAEFDEAKGAIYINPQQETVVWAGKKRPRKDEVLAALGLAPVAQAA